MKNKILILAAFFVLAACTENKTINQTNPPVSQAGGQTRTSDPDGWGGGSTGDGGGGQGVMCSDEVADSRLKGRLFVRDVFEALYNKKLTMALDTLGDAGTDKVDEKAFKFLNQKLMNFYGASMTIQEFALNGFWEKFEQKISFLDSTTNLIPSKDDKSPIALPRGCSLVQIAYYSESGGIGEEGTLFVDKANWKNLDQFNKVALLAHEYFFRWARASGFKSSDYVRNKVGRLLSEEGLPAILPNWEPSDDPALKKVERNMYLPKHSKGFKACFGSTRAQQGAMILFQYQDVNGLQNLVWVRLGNGNTSMPPFESARTWFDPADPKYDLLAAATDFLHQTPDHPASARDRLRLTNKLEEAAADPDDRMGIVIVPMQNGTAKVSVKNPMGGIIPLNDREPLPREELIRLLQREVIDTLHKSIENRAALDYGKILLAFSKLKSEAESSFTAEKPATNLFQEWADSLKEFEKVGVKFSPEDQAYMYNTVPFSILDFTHGSYSNENVGAAVGNKGFKKVWKDTSYGGMVVANFGAERVEYITTCYNYDEYYQLMLTGTAGDVANKDEVAK
jgi:hypothetical protein